MLVVVDLIQELLEINSFTIFNNNIWSNFLNEKLDIFKKIKDFVVRKSL